MNKKEKEVEVIARSALDCIERVAGRAEENLKDYRIADARAFAAVNTFNDMKQVSRIGEIGEANRAALQFLTREPIIARVTYVDESGNEGTLYISRGSPQGIEGARVASYRSPAGRIASILAGDEFELSMDGRRIWVSVRSSTKLHPLRERDGWDSRNNEIHLESRGKLTVTSLRALLQLAAEPEDDILKHLLAEDEPNIVEGIRRGILSHIGLRDQPILDRRQDEIFRLPINSRCFLFGPPGTGKTTTLIRRLGQKLDLDALDSSESALIRRVEEGAPLAHAQSWVMFSPTELLRQYVKEAFTKEGIAASDDHIKTWVEYRRDFARNVVGILRTSTGRGQFIERTDESYLDPRCSTQEATAWYDDFERYLQQQLYIELSADAHWLATSGIDELAVLGGNIEAILGKFKQSVDGAIAPQLAGLVEDIRRLMAQRKADADKLIEESLRRILHQDRQFLDRFAQEVANQSAASNDDLGEDEDVESDLDDDEEVENLPNRTVSRKQARAQYERVVRALARTNARGRKVSDKTRSGLLLRWLGDTRVPESPALDALAAIIAQQARLRRFANIDSLLIRSLSRLFKKYRRERAEESVWFKAEPARSSDICWKEIDLILLAILKMTGSIFSAYSSVPGAEIPGAGVLGGIRARFRHQVLVDEATDFSPIQLAIMYELAHPALKSFFACGDFNQRLTDWGITHSADLDWIEPAIECRKITVSYRQTGRLVELAKAVAALGGSEESEIVLPDRLDSEGESPVWAPHLATDEAVSRWLAERIREIEQTLGTVPSIAILVNDEARVEALATILGRELQRLNLNAAACKDGKVVGSDQDVRVFNLQHIKGMEFEAVFFIDLDKVMASKADLYAKYLYVGATRAAAYLGITFANDVPKALRALKPLFKSQWS